MLDKVEVIPFKASSVDTIGMEIEFQLLDPASLDLVEGILPLMERYPDSPYIKPEFIQNTVEVATPVCHSIEELNHQLRSLVKDLMGNCTELNMKLCGSGTHPYCRRRAEITPLQRYLEMEKVQGYTSHTQITFAMHVHLGMRSGDEAIAIMRGLKRYLPLLIALSANSPYWRGHDTDYDSFRHFILAARRSYGEPPSFTDWQDFNEFFVVAQRVGIFESIHEIHWDIRPRPHLGSLEVRVMDAQPTVTDALALAAFLQALVAYLRKELAPPIELKPNALHDWINRDNYYRAARHGLRSSFFDEDRDISVPIAQLYDELDSRIYPIFTKLHTTKWCTHLEQLVSEGGSAERQRQLFRKYGGLKPMTAFLVKSLEDDIKEIDFLEPESASI